MAISRLFSRKSTKSHSNVVPQDAKHSLYGPESNNVSGRLETPNRPPKNNKERLEFAEIEAQNNQYTLMEVKNSLAKSLNQREAKKVRPVELQRGWTMAKQDADARREQTARLQAAVDKAKSDRLVVVEEMQVSDKAGEAERQESALLREKIRRLLEKRDAFQMAKKETKAAEREPSFEASRTNPLSVGRRIKTHGLVNNASLNEVKGTLLEEVRNNVWKVRFDQDLGEHLLKEANMKTLEQPPAVSSPWTPHPCMMGATMGMAGTMHGAHLFLASTSQPSFVAQKEADKGLFDKLDSNNDGVISRQEFDSAMPSGMIQEANDIVSKLAEALNEKVTTSMSKVATLDLQTGMVRQEHEKLLDEIAVVTRQRDAARNKLTEVHTFALLAEEYNDALRKQICTKKEKLQEISHKCAVLKGVIATLEEETGLCGTNVKAMTSICHGETGLVKPVLELTKGQKQEVEDRHVVRVAEIASAVEAHQRRADRDATLDDVAPEDAIVETSLVAPWAPMVEFSPRDVMPALKMKEFSRVTPNSTGIPDPKVLVRAGQRMTEAASFHPTAIKSREVCGSCGSVLMGDAQFCRNCGHKRDINTIIQASTVPILSQESCLTCGNVFIGDAAFCRKCGTRRLAGPSA